MSTLSLCAPRVCAPRRCAQRVRSAGATAARPALPARCRSLTECASLQPVEEQAARGAKADAFERSTAAGPSTRAQQALWSSPGALFLLAAGEAAAEGDESGYSKSSYYATLFLFLISFPGLYSLVKRSAKSKIERKTFEVPGPAVAGAVTLDERARALFAHFKRNNYAVTATGEVITFEGTIAPERGQAAYITFCAFIGLASGALVTSIAVPWIGDSAYWATALSPAAGAYYWVNAGRQETMRVKMVTADDELTSDIVIEGDANEIERCARELKLVEKGKIYVKGLLEPSSESA